MQAININNPIQQISEGISEFIRPLASSIASGSRVTNSIQESTHHTIKMKKLVETDDAVLNYIDNLTKYTEILYSYRPSSRPNATTYKLLTHILKRYIMVRDALEKHISFIEEVAVDGSIDQNTVKLLKKYSEYKVVSKKFIDFIDLVVTVYESRKEHASGKSISIEEFSLN